MWREPESVKTPKNGSQEPLVKEPGDFLEVLGDIYKDGSLEPEAGSKAFFRGSQSRWKKVPTPQHR